MHALPRKRQVLRDGAAVGVSGRQYQVHHFRKGNQILRCHRPRACTETPNSSVLSIVAQERGRVGSRYFAAMRQRWKTKLQELKVGVRQRPATHGA